MIAYNAGTIVNIRPTSESHKVDSMFLIFKKNDQIVHRPIKKSNGGYRFKNECVFCLPYTQYAKTLTQANSSTSSTNKRKSKCNTNILVLNQFITHGYNYALRFKHTNKFTTAKEAFEKFEEWKLDKENRLFGVAANPRIESQDQI